MSDILARKLRTHFRRFDFNHDGRVTREEYVGMADRLFDLEKFDQATKDRLRKTFDDLYIRYSWAAGTDGSAVLTEDLLIDSIRLQLNDPEFLKVLSTMLLAFFNAMDTNQDNYLSFAEYNRFFDHLGFDVEKFTKAAFDAIDADKDGKLSFQEFVDAADDYLRSEKEDSTAMFGLLA